MATWPATEEELEALQRELALAADAVPRWVPSEGPLAVAGVFCASPTGSSGRAGEPMWAAAVVLREGREPRRAVVRGVAPAPYRPGFLALREGVLLERAARALEEPPDVLLVNATGRDHPRRAGLALHLGAVLELPTIGLTDRPLLASPADPGPDRGDRVPLLLEGEPVAAAVRTRAGSRPVVVHAAWRTDVEEAVAVALATSGPARTPEPLRLARRLARVARASDEGRLPPGWRDAPLRGDGSAGPRPPGGAPR
jgi:deoxyribonuclease V